jgi:hypothetical protein
VLAQAHQRRVLVVHLHAQRAIGLLADLSGTLDVGLELSGVRDQVLRDAAEQAGIEE